MPDVDWYSMRAASDVTFVIRRSTVASVTADFSAPAPVAE
jgi:hypothetical protein